MEVHRRAGPGLLESIYCNCLQRELALRGIATAREVPISMEYKGAAVGHAFRADFIVDDADSRDPSVHP